MGNRVLLEVANGALRLLLAAHSTVLLEPQNLEFTTLEEAAEWVTIHPEQFSGAVYVALLERLEALGGGGLWNG